MLDYYFFDRLKSNRRTNVAYSITKELGAGYNYYTWLDAYKSEDICLIATMSDRLAAPHTSESGDNYKLTKGALSLVNIGNSDHISPLYVLISRLGYNGIIRAGPGYNYGSMISVLGGATPASEFMCIGVARGTEAAYGGGGSYFPNKYLWKEPGGYQITGPRGVYAIEVSDDDSNAIAFSVTDGLQYRLNGTWYSGISTDIIGSVVPRSGLAATPDCLTAICCVGSGLLYKTDWYGLHWSPLNAGGSRNWLGVRISSNGLIMLAWTSTVVLRSIDGGLSFIEIQPSGMAAINSCAMSRSGLTVWIGENPGYMYTIRF